MREEFMDKVYFTKEKFNKLWNKLEYLGKGGEGTRKKLNKSETIKYLDGPYNDLTETQINQFIDLKNQTYLPVRTIPMGTPPQERSHNLLRTKY